MYYEYKTFFCQYPRIKIPQEDFVTMQFFGEISPCHDRHGNNEEMTKLRMCLIYMCIVMRCIMNIYKIFVNTPLALL